MRDEVRDRSVAHVLCGRDARECRLDFGRDEARVSRLPQHRRRALVVRVLHHATERGRDFEKLVRLRWCARAARTRRLVSREQFAAAFDERFGGARVLQLRERAHGAHAHARVRVRRRVQGERVEGRGVLGCTERASGVRARHRVSVGRKHRAESFERLLRAQTR